MGSCAILSGFLLFALTTHKCEGSGIGALAMQAKLEVDKLRLDLSELNC